MKKLLSLITGIIALFAASFVYAVHVNSVYTADMLVPSQSTDDRLAAEGPALEQVLVKLSGDTNVVNNPAVEARLKNADKLVQEFSYSPSPDTPKTPYVLHVVFDTEAVNHILRDGDIATWGENRPLILAWISYEPPNKVAEIVDADTEPHILSLLKKHADQRGIPLITPMMDISDMNQVGVNDIVTMAVPTLQNVSKRYGNDALLIARILKNTDGYEIQSKLIKDTKEWSWNIKGKSVDDVITQLMNDITNTLAGQYASVVSDNVQTQFTLKITGISQQSDLAEVMNYLKHLAPVADVEPLDISDNEVLLTVSLRGSQDAFIQAVAGEDKLQRVPSVAGAATDPNLLVYQWNP